jgi:beta-mannosidase
MTRKGLLFAAAAVCLSVALAASVARAAGVKAKPAGASNLTLDGNDWRMGWFEFGEGLKAGAAAESFNDSAFQPVTVPGDTQVQAGFTGVAGFEESKGLMEVNAREWWYRKHFRPGAAAPGTVTRLVFDGADYFTTVWLNGQLVGTHEGGYVGFSFDVTKLLRAGADNVLAVMVTHPWAPKDRAVDEYIDGNFSMALGTPMRGLPYHVGISWDGLAAQGNAAVPMGIWRSVHLVTSGPLTVSDLHVVTTAIDADGSARLHITATVDNAGAAAQAGSLRLVLRPANFPGAAQPIPALSIHAVPGQTAVETDVRVADARLWWSWDRGAQNLYELKAAFDADGAARDERTVRFGIRTITRDAEMAYHLNGQKLFVKASWFPIESFYRSQATAEGYERDLRLFRDANFNLLVNFTVVEKPEFYDLCDELGILLIVELPFEQFGPQHVLDKDSPRRAPFLEQARVQVRQMIVAERNHPSVIQWVPLAEAHDKDQGKWGSFGPGGWWATDQEGYDTFIAEMKELVTTLAPDTVFHPSLCDLGEQHFWMAGQAWEGGVYQEHFDAKSGFISEYGTISMSSYENLGKYLTPEQQWDSAGGTRAWFNLPIDLSAYSYWTANMDHGLYSMLYRSRHFVDSDPRSARELVEDTQLYQAFLLRYSAEAYRRKKYEPVNGIRNWDFLEVTPAFRFAIVDFDRVPKIGYWYMKHAQAPVAVSFAWKDVLESQLAGSAWAAPVWAINDLNREVRGTVHAELLTLGGERVAAAEFPVAVPADGKAMAGTFSLTLPRKAGVYVLRAELSVAGAEPVEETSFIKVVPAAFSGAHRVLLLGTSRSATPIAAVLRSMGLVVDLYDENGIGDMARSLTNAAEIHARYDAIWLANFEWLAKVLPAETAAALRDAVKAGTGFIHTGGEGSFHGGNGQAALLEATALNAVLPVETAGREDLSFVAHDTDDGLFTQHRITSIAAGEKREAATGFSPETLALLRHYGLQEFNRVTARAGAAVGLTVDGQPLLVTGSYGAGRTVAFTGFTPVASEFTALPMDEYLMKEPELRAYFALFADLLADVLVGHPQHETGLLELHEKPLFQTLKEQPRTELAVTKVGEMATEGAVSRCRVRVENRGGYAHMVHLRAEWQGAGTKPFLTEFSDDDFELMPKEAKEIAVEWRGASGQAGTLVVDAANAAEVRVAF